MRCSVPGSRPPPCWRLDEISKEDYDKWRYHYPEFDKTQNYVKVPPQDLFLILFTCRPRERLFVAQSRDKKKKRAN